MVIAIFFLQSCAKISDYIKEAKSDPDVSLITGGNVVDR